MFFSRALCLKNTLCNHTIIGLTTILSRSCDRGIPRVTFVGFLYGAPRVRARFPRGAIMGYRSSDYNPLRSACAIVTAFPNTCNLNASMTPRLRHHFSCTFCTLSLLHSARAETTPPPTLDIPAAARPGPNFDVKAATDAWLATIPPDKKARSDSYFEGGYWLQLWDFVSSPPSCCSCCGAASRPASAIGPAPDRAQKSPDAPLFVPFFLITSRCNSRYGLRGILPRTSIRISTRLSDLVSRSAVGLAIGLVLGAIAIMILFAIVRRLGENWWAWGAIASILLLSSWS